MSVPLFLSVCLICLRMWSASGMLGARMLLMLSTTSKCLYARRLRMSACSTVVFLRACILACETISGEKSMAVTCLNRVLR